MSKSLGNTIGLLEPEESIWQKIQHLPDDPQRIRLSDPGDPERTILFTYLSYFAPKDLVEALKEEYRKAGVGTYVVKRILFDHLMEALRPIRERAEALKKDPDYVMDALWRAPSGPGPWPRRPWRRCGRRWASSCPGSARSSGDPHRLSRL